MGFLPLPAAPLAHQCSSCVRPPPVPGPAAKLSCPRLSRHRHFRHLRPAPQIPTTVPLPFFKNLAYNQRCLWAVAPEFEVSKSPIPQPPIEIPSPPIFLWRTYVV
jgi:hypothetical protein